MAHFTDDIDVAFPSPAASGSGGGVLPIWERSNGSGVNAQAGANDGLLVEFPSGATAPLPSGAATATAQATLAALVETPDTPTTIVPSDATDTSAITAKGLIVTSAGNLVVRGTGAPSTSVTIAVVAGQYVPLQCSRVMAASTAGSVGLS